MDRDSYTREITFCIIATRAEPRLTRLTPCRIRIGTSLSARLSTTQRIRSVASLHQTQERSYDATRADFFKARAQLEAYDDVLRKTGMDKMFVLKAMLRAAFAREARPPSQTAPPPSAATAATRGFRRGAHGPFYHIFERSRARRERLFENDPVLSSRWTSTRTMLDARRATRSRAIYDKILTFLLPADTTWVADLLEAMVNLVNLVRFLATQVMHVRARSLDNVSIKIAQYPVSSALKPSDEGPILDTLIKMLNSTKLPNQASTSGLTLSIVAIRGDGEDRNDAALTCYEGGMPTTMQALADRAAVTSAVAFKRLLLEIGSNYTGRGAVSIEDTKKLKAKVAQLYYGQDDVSSSHVLIGQWLGVRSELLGGVARELPVREGDMLARRDQLLARIGQSGGRGGMSADELKAELKARKLSEHGTKAVLQDRLREAVAAPSAAPAAAPTPPRPDEYWLDRSPATQGLLFGDDELMFDVLPFAGEDDPPAGDGDPPAGDGDPPAGDGDRRPTTHVHVHPPVHALTAANRANNAEWQRRDEDGSLRTSSLNYMGDRAFLELENRRELGRSELAQTILARHGPHTLLGEEADVPRVSGFVASLYDDQKLASRQSVMLTKERRAQTRAILAFYKHLGPLGAIDQCGEHPPDLGAWQTHLANENDAWKWASVAALGKAYRVERCSTDEAVPLADFKSLLLEIEIRRLMKDAFDTEGVDYRKWLYCPDVRT